MVWIRTQLYFLVAAITYFGNAQSSVLSTGNWYRVAVMQNGVYKLGYEDLLALGLDVGSLDPRSLKVYGNTYNGILPQENDALRPGDLVENAIVVVGGNDGEFDPADYMLFYGKGPDKLSWDSGTSDYEKNIYSDTAFYFITTGGSEGLRVSEKVNVPAEGLAVEAFDDFIVFEDDVNNLLNSGRGWYGDLMGTGEQVSSSHTLEGIVSDINLTFSAISQSPEANSFVLSANGAAIGSLELESIPTGEGTTYSIKAREATNAFVIDQNENLDLRFTFEANSASARGFINYYTLSFSRELRLYGDQTSFRHKENIGELLTFQISGPSNVTVWDVTSPTEVLNQQYDQEEMISFTSQSNQVQEFIIFSEHDLPSPILVGPVPNQDLRGDTRYDGVIVAHDRFLNEAERLAQFHRDHDQLLVKVVTPTQIYNEFSSGRQDISAIRDYARHVYENGSRLKYLLLFGDCSYDYKDRKLNNTNFVPTYESRNSFHPIFSYSSDDYFGFFDEDEGQWNESSSGDHTLEIGIGRLPAKSEEEAKNMVDKIIFYSTSPKTLGKWRNQITYVADDGDANIHARHVEDLSTLVDTTYSQYKVEKLLLDRFNQEVKASGERSPETTRALKARIKEGTFSVNFIGHGNERLWMVEQVLTHSVIDELNNRNKLPVFVTATCEFGRYDDPGQESGGEKLLLKKNSGAIALLTTSRPVFASTNFRLNEAFHENMYVTAGDEQKRLGDIIKGTKNEGLAGPVNRNFALLGDPMLMPSYPKLSIGIDQLTQQTDTLSALEEVTFTGQIQGNGTLKSDFNGIVDIEIFDDKQTFLTKGQQSAPYSYALRSNAIFRGQSTVKDGRFSFTFIVPKTITYQFARGRMSLYARDMVLNADAMGASEQFVIGGTEPSSEDNRSPEVEMYLNHASFVSGSEVGPSSVLVAKISDANGINTTGNGLINGITLTLADQVINLNAFYTADLDTYQSGTVVYPIEDLEPGTYSASLTVYDTYNNPTTSELSFRVSDGNFISVFNKLVYPNPASGKVTFSFEHDREEEDLRLRLFVYNTKGEVVNESGMILENSNRLISFDWNARTTSGQPLTTGIYFYRLVIRSEADGVIKELSGKIAITGG